MKIITPATSEPITLEMARKQCKVDASGSPPAHEDDDLIELFTSAAREWCEAYLGTPIAPTLVEIALDAFPEEEIALESGPVVSVSSVTYLDEDSVEQTVDPLVYALDTNDQVAVLRLNTDQTWPTALSQANSIRIRYTIGYSADGESPLSVPLPKSIKLAILLLLGHLYKNRSETVDKNLTNIPFGVTAFLHPLKLRMSFA